ncbi:glucan 1,4-alpha-glucosidase [Caldilinea sp.]|uniref:glucan 1,4-alpha-glucosidase n=1 Tax=Caldilinea sp. TaxID=2293560 RepID=UPI002635B7BC|nr:glucan 1,4-alpha-glucosidase [uncultured Caldilinea sp.]
MDNLMNPNAANPPGAPGISPRWTSSAKVGVGTALGPASRVWFTLSHGILNEVYYPRVDQACIRDLGLIVTDGRMFFSEEKRHARSQVAYLAEGAPAYRLVNTCIQGRYRIEKEILADPQRDVVLQFMRFTPLQGVLSDYHLYVLLAPHLGNRGANNTAWVGDYKGVPMLFAQRENLALALACSAPWLKRSVGYVGFSDGWQDLMRHKQMTWSYLRAENGNVALTGEIDLQSGNGEWVLALGFGGNSAEAGQRALQSLQDGFEAAKVVYIREWQDWQTALLPLERTSSIAPDLYRVSAAVLRTHEDVRLRGGVIASLSIPWGSAKGDDDLGGYHLVWPRDLVETAGGLLACGATLDVRLVLAYLQATQEADGHWPQNMWLDGTPYWSGVQMDETAFPILLVDIVRREGVLGADEIRRFWPMVFRAASFLVRNGPVTQQDRWEEDPGYSPFTLAVEIAALLAAADLAELNQEPAMAAYLREAADAWNANIERWTYVTGTDLAQQVGVDGYYVRIAPPDEAEAASPSAGYVPIKNRPPGENSAPAVHLVSPDALALVRFGLRAPDDPRIVNTVKVIDALLKVETPSGPAWRRYNGDGYGEHEDGSPFDGEGIGRAWPLLTGERAHYELAAGRLDEAQRLLLALESFANEGKLIPEQIWDAPDIPARELFCGRPSGSAMPLVWAHAEYIKLCRSLRDNRVFDTPPQPVARYIMNRQDTPFAIWRFNHKTRIIPTGKTLRLEVLAPANVHWSTDDWRTIHDTATRDTGLGVHVADLPTGTLPAGSTIFFTFYWLKVNRWEGVNFAVRVDSSSEISIR